MVPRGWRTPRLPAETITLPRSRAVYLSYTTDCRSNETLVQTAVYDIPDLTKASNMEIVANIADHRTQFICLVKHGLAAFGGTLRRKDGLITGLCRLWTQKHPRDAPAQRTILHAPFKIEDRSDMHLSKLQRSCCPDGQNELCLRNPVDHFIVRMEFPQRSELDLSWRDFARLLSRTPRDEVS
jgi:hypothetical protein